MRRRSVIILGSLVVLTAAAVAAVLWRLPPPATALGEPPRGDVVIEVPGTWDVGGFEVTLTADADSGRLVVTHPDAAAAVWETPPGAAFLTAATGEPTWRDDVGLLRVADEHVAVWRHQGVHDATVVDGDLVLSGRLMSDGDDELALDWEMTLREGAPGRLDVTVTAGRPAAAASTTGTAQPGQNVSEGLLANRLYLAASLEPDEAVHGLGGQTGDFDLRGRRVLAMAREQGVGRGNQPLSFLVDLAAASAGGQDTGYLTSTSLVTGLSRGLAYTGERISSVDLRGDDRMVWEVWAPEATFSAVAASRPLDAVGLHSTWTGAAEPPPAWVDAGLVAGLQGGTEEVRRKIRTLQDADVPLAAVWLQDWSGRRDVDFGARLHWNWTLDAERYPGWEGLVADLDREGIRVLTYASPFLSRDSGARAGAAGGRDLFAEAEALGHLVLEADGEPYELDQRDFHAGLVDLSSTAAREWLTEVLVDEVAGSGASGWMADFSEGPPPDAVLDGGPAVDWRARWPVLWQEVCTEALHRAGLADDGLVWHRTAHAASAGAADALWLGDQMQDWSREDGLASVPALLHSAAVSGMAQVHGDVGGYTSLALPVLPDVGRDAELVQRWAEASVLGPVLRTHEGNRPDDVAQPAEDVDLARALGRSVRLFTALAPERRRLVADGGPLAAAQHHPWVHHPDEPALLDAAHQTMLGPDVVLIPVLAPGADDVAGVLPPGRWTHVWSGAQYGAPAAATDVSVAAPLGEPAIFVRSGSPVAAELAALAAAEAG